MTFKPDWYSPTGDTIKQIIRERKTGRRITAEKLGIPLTTLNLIIKGEEPITEKLAEKLAEVLGSTKEFWLRREQTFRKDKKRLTNGKT